MMVSIRRCMPAAHETVRAHLEKLETSKVGPRSTPRMVGRLRQPDSGDDRMHGQRHRLHQRQPRALPRRAEGAAGDSEHQRAARACRRRRRCAEWCADEMRRIGLQNVRLIETPGNPVVYGDWLGAPGAPTILFYGHYDVQPVDPLESVGVAAVRGDDPRRRDLRARLGRRQGPGVHAPQGDRSAPEAERPPAGEHEVHPRRRRGSRQRQPRRLHPRPQGRAGGRRRRDFGFGDVRPRRAVDLLRPARPGLLPDRPARQQHRPALRRRSAAPSPTRRSCWRR